MANQPENRAKQPWIIAFSHRPMYCSNYDYEHCLNPDNRFREGIVFTDGKSKYHVLGLEDLFYREGVDIIFGAHRHCYERFYPLYKRKICPTYGNDPYFNPTGPIHIIAGAAGNNEGQTPFLPNPPASSAFRSDDYGYTRIVVHNGSYMYMEEISVKSAQGLRESPTVIDKFEIRKSTTRPEFTCHQRYHFYEPPVFSLWDWLHIPKGDDL
ncbi:hypothetical protein Aperf_G00000125644 [Anoplocephala perfoliata]